MKLMALALGQIILAFGFLGCSMEASITSLKAPTKLPTFQKGSNVEFVSGGYKDGYQTTDASEAPQGYHVRAAIGHVPSKQAAKTTNRGYIVFSTVQGATFSDELVSEWGSNPPTGSPSTFNPN